MPYDNLTPTRSTWARLIKKVYEVDPLICPHCGGQMRFLAVIGGWALILGIAACVLVALAMWHWEKKNKTLDKSSDDTFP